MRLYLDTSILVPLWIRESRTEQLEAWLESTDSELLISDLADAEFRAALSRRVRVGELNESQAAELHYQFDRWRERAAEPLENLPVDIRRAARLVRQPFPKLLSPDAIHLATCERLELTLVTHDTVLAEIARRARVTVIEPD